MKLGVDLDLCANHLQKQPITFHRGIAVIIVEKFLLAAMTPMRNHRSTTSKVVTLALKECGRFMLLAPNLFGIDIPLVGAAR